MRIKFSILASLIVLTFGVSSILAQETVATSKKVVVNPDGTYTVIEYPVGKEVRLSLLPAGTITGTGNLRVTRSADGTRLFVDMTGIPADVSTYHAYAVDPAGTATLLGPISFTSGVGKAEFVTPMNQFMVVLSPTEGLTTIDPTTTVLFRSELPSGYVVVPRRITGDTTATAVSATTLETYNVPVLNVPTFGDKERELKVKFDSGDLAGLEGKAYIKRKKGKSTVKMKFDDLNKVPKGKRFVLWASSPDGQFTKIGQVINSGKKDEAEIRSEVSLNDFGLFLTVEDAEVMIPTSTTYSVFAVTPMP